MKEVDWLLKEKYLGKKTAGFFADLKRLENGEPLSYIIGHQPFLNTTIYLDSYPLIPRTETEFWVEKLIIETKQSGADYPQKILDLCAGSGCIGVALGLAFPKSTITFAEIDETHHKTIQKNCSANHLTANRYSIVGGNLFNQLSNKTFDLIVSNPPYIDRNLNRTDASVLNFEPTIALFAKNNGLQILQSIIEDAPRSLKQGGELWLEHEPEQVTALQKLAEKRFKIYTRLDQYGVKRVSKLVLQ